jgi:outer membrane lipoprotein SlyB
MVKLAEIREEMKGRIQARSFWDEIEKIGAAKEKKKGRGGILGSGIGRGSGHVAAAALGGFAGYHAAKKKYAPKPGILSKLKKFIKK